MHVRHRVRYRIYSWKGRAVNRSCAARCYSNGAFVLRCRFDVASCIVVLRCAVAAPRPRRCQRATTKRMRRSFSCCSRFSPPSYVMAAALLVRHSFHHHLLNVKAHFAFGSTRPSLCAVCSWGTPSSWSSCCGAGALRYALFAAVHSCGMERAVRA